MRNTNKISQRKALWFRADGQCERCGRIIHQLGPALEDGSRHHRHRQDQGGRNRLYNLVLVCVKCHRWIHAHEDLAAQDGWILPCDTAAVPLLRHDGWVLLGARGGFERLSEYAGRSLLSWATSSLSRSGVTSPRPRCRS